MAAHGDRALAIAQMLQERGLKVCYPGLQDHPDHQRFGELHCADYGYGGVMTVDMDTEAAANTLMSKLQNAYGFGFMAVSLGYFDTLMSCSGSSTSSEKSDADKASAGISPGLVRLSVGYTGTLEQRWQQLRDALRDVEKQRTFAKAG
jgi:methionine-gamma-lyase